jgi:hypothetical protein
MGFRFRKSFQLIPGLKLNVGTGGLSLTAGVPGMSVGIGQRRTSLNLGIPGTGLSYNQTLLRHGQGGRAGYRSASSEHREAAREAARTANLLDQQAAEREVEELVALAKVLANRVREPFNLHEMLAPQDVFVPTEYHPRRVDLSPGAFLAEASERRPVLPWLMVALLGCIPSIALLDGAWTAGGIGLHLGTAVVGAFVQSRRARSLADTLAANAAVNHEAAEVERRQSHDADQLAAEGNFKRHEAYKRELRHAIAEGRPEPLASLLEVELSNEDFPVPVVVEMDFDGLERVTLELTLPELADIPADQPRILASGKVSRKPISQTDRGALYDTLCCGTALRLIYESFRVLPMLDRVDLRGTFEGIDALGRVREGMCMHIAVSRRQFDEINLDLADPTVVMRTLGRFNCNKKGELKAIVL